MDDRPSGLPRPSKLPLARSSIPKPSTTAPRPPPTAQPGIDAAPGRNTPNLRNTSSQSQLRQTGFNYGETRTTKLRNSASRDKLRTTSTTTTTKPAQAKTRAHPTTPAHAKQISSFSHLVTPRRNDEPTDNPEAAPTTPPDDDVAESAHAAEFPVPRRSLRSRPSLSERTMDTLAQIPPSPALRKKSSSFFDSTRSPSRNSHSTSRPGSSFSRPDSRLGAEDTFNEDPTTNPRTPARNFQSSLATIKSTPSATPPGSLQKSRNRVSLGNGTRSVNLAANRSPSPEKKPYGALPPKSAPKPALTRPTAHKRAVKTPRPTRKPSIDTNPADSDTVGSSWDGSIAPLAKPGTVKSDEPAAQSRKSSAALRDQIAKARAAKRAAMKQEPPSTSSVPSQDETILVPADDGFDFGVDHEDPFNLQKGVEAGEKVLKQRLGAARSSGRLNIAALGLKTIPSQVMKMYSMESIGGQGTSWAESVDLTRFIAADNELESLDDDMFPDKDLHSLSLDDDETDNIFGGLDTLDLHGNKIVRVPLGLRRLGMLSSLNLSSNQLSNDCLDIIAQLPNLRDLKLANNRLDGTMTSEMANLANLEILDLHGNNVSALPEGIERMSRLRILNLSENSFEAIDLDGLSQLPLTDLSLRKNKLSGTLISRAVHGFSHLQTLDISVNQLKYLSPIGMTVELPVLHTLSASINRLQELPDMSGWQSLITLTVDENSISCIPESLPRLVKLRQADFSSNDIRVIPPEIAKMNSLSVLRLTGNPLRDKKFISISTDELKEVLLGRLEPPPPYQEPSDPATITDLMSQTLSLDHDVKRAAAQDVTHSRMTSRDYDSRSDMDDFATPPQSPSRSRSHTLSQPLWPVKPGGTLDRSASGTSTLDSAIASRIAADHRITAIHLQQNQFTEFPSLSLSFFAQSLSVLSLAHNQLCGTRYFTTSVDDSSSTTTDSPLRLPVLRELNLSSNRITSLGPLTAHLEAPQLEKLDVSINRITSLPSSKSTPSPLKAHFPKLFILLISSNLLTELEPESIRGLKILDASSNDIAHLNPRIGLLGGSSGVVVSSSSSGDHQQAVPLQRLDVAGNRFKVPRWDVLQKGTEATLKWLRGRLPDEELGEWKRMNGEETDEEEAF